MNISVLYRTKEMALQCVIDWLRQQDIPTEIACIIGGFAQEDIDFHDFLKLVKQNDHPIYFRHGVDGDAFEESVIHMEIYDGKLRLCREGNLHKYDHVACKPVDTLLDDHLDVMVTNIYRMLDNVLYTRDTVEAYGKVGEPSCAMPNGIDYALFDLIERMYGLEGFPYGLEELPYVTEVDD